MTSALLQGEDVTVRRDGRLIVRGLSLRIESGEIVGLSGPSGCGKSTLLLAMFGLLPMEYGHVTYATESNPFIWPPVRSNPPEIAFRRYNQLLLQNSHSSLNPRRTLLEELYRVAKLHRPNSDADEHRYLIEEIAALAELPLHVLNRHPSQISGGEAQRATLARALLVGPRFLACDEIWASLDLLTTLKVVQLLRSLRSKGLTLLVVSHQTEILFTLCDRIVEFTSSGSVRKS